ncbi:uncharacterized protein CC84DRAFT_834674 [Paraphaeosphaeria sporulosa]|uniref:Uncharacterized protein n=1 Tax=Paraphaeosphaeria sporulosa TaxID=1460663 RepID=A0A177CCF0_9PLEO|nr:uncharacterized protein CC84DRAFT_834674 [Paraphaeosphaeria sporulosa]OAG05315.1 hypothetical protein CC84DRAFT_834674 [Paraphaeosphaeria sporulosa]
MLIWPHTCRLCRKLRLAGLACALVRPTPYRGASELDLESKSYAYILKIESSNQLALSLRRCVRGLPHPMLGGGVHIIVVLLARLLNTGTGN